jgi:hypothetical protein
LHARSFPRVTRIVTLLSLVALALVASANVAPPALATPRVQAQISAKAAQNLAPLSSLPASCGVGVPCTPPLLPHGGPVQQHPVVYLIFWGSK